jgi:hypothetical protein
VCIYMSCFSSTSAYSTVSCHPPQHVAGQALTLCKLFLCVYTCPVSPAPLPIVQYPVIRHSTWQDKPSLSVNSSCVCIYVSCCCSTSAYSAAPHPPQHHQPCVSAGTRCGRGRAATCWVYRGLGPCVCGGQRPGL